MAINGSSGAVLRTSLPMQFGIAWLTATGCTVLSTAIALGLQHRGWGTDASIGLAIIVVAVAALMIHIRYPRFLGVRPTEDPGMVQRTANGLVSVPAGPEDAPPLPSPELPVRFPGWRERATSAPGYRFSYREYEAAYLSPYSSAIADFRAKFWAFRKIGSDYVLYAFVEALQDKDPTVRTLAAEALGQIGSDRAVDALRDALHDTNVRVQTTVAKALGKIGSDRAVDALIKALHDGDSSVRAEVAEALGQIGPDQAVDALREALHDKNDEVWRSVAGALHGIGSEYALYAFMAALQDTDSSVRAVAAEAIGQIGSDRAVDALMDVLRDENARVRAEAVWALGEIGSEQAVDALKEALHGEDTRVRVTAAGALQEIGSDHALRALREARQIGLLDFLDKGTGEESSETAGSV